MIKTMKLGVVILTALVIGLGLSGVSMATVHTDPVCMRCHTMHYSEDGGVPDADQGFGMDAGSESSTTGPFPHLLLDSGSDLCLGCHAKSGTAGAIGDYNVGGDAAPAVYNSTGHSAGDFIYADADGGATGASVANGHNPGGTIGFDTDSYASDKAPGGAKYPNGVSPDPTDSGLDVEAFMCISCHAPHGITGTNNPDGVYAYKLLRKEIHGLPTGNPLPDQNDGLAIYNSYSYATAEGSGNYPIYTDGLSNWCGGCHGSFHNADKTGDTGYGNETNTVDWVRHPTDTTLTDDTDFGDEQTNYGTSYSWNYPVEAPTGTFNNTTAQVFCLSCHRAHASPYKNAMRWKEDASAQGSQTGTGCNKCHAKG